MRAMDRWWEKANGKAAIRQVTAAMGTQRNADNTMEIKKPIDDFEKYGLLDNDKNDQPAGVQTLHAATYCSP